MDRVEGGVNRSARGVLEITEDRRDALERVWCVSDGQETEYAEHRADAGYECQQAEDEPRGNRERDTLDQLVRIKRFHILVGQD